MHTTQSRDRTGWEIRFAPINPWNSSQEHLPYHWTCASDSHIAGILGTQLLPTCHFLL